MISIAIQCKNVNLICGIIITFVGGHHIPQGRAMNIPHLGPRVFPSLFRRHPRWMMRVNLMDFHQDCKCSVKFFCASFLRMDSPFS